ncbi:MAG TPA: hypothetical protein VMU38_06820 [Candidatus Binatia bacterium]|nr:hypothetical protein [Candidatus Binatia bacterium]
MIGTSRASASAGWYDWLMAVASLWLSGGIMIDAWYHFHSTVESFFEPAHALLYAGLLAAYVFTALAAVSGRRRGYPWRLALPAGYETTFAGLIVCLIGGIGDMIKHSLWGFEQGFNALLSPTHLVIGAGMFLIIAGPIRSGLTRARPPATLIAQLPMLLSAASMMELAHWGTQFIFMSEAESFNAPLPPASVPHWTLTLLTLQYDKQGIGLLAVIVQSILIVGFVLYIARRLRPAPGAATVLLVTGNAFIAAAGSNYAGQFLSVVFASLVAGGIADAARLDPADQLSLRWPIAAFAIPSGYWTAMLAALAVTMGGIWWSPDVISGSILFAGLAGLFLNALTGPFQRAT